MNAWFELQVDSDRKKKMCRPFPCLGFGVVPGGATIPNNAHLNPRQWTGDGHLAAVGVNPGLMDVLSTIARGGFGRVDRVRLPNGEIVARKVFDPQIPLNDAEREKLRERFRREVRVQAALDPEFVMPVLQFELAGDAPWYVMPLAERTLDAQIQSTGGVTEEIEQALADLLNALDYLHGLGYVHRDLKPRNVLQLDGRWRLGDFGLVLPATGTTTKLTATQSGWGTPEYCAPEQHADFRGATAQADIYSFGCILHDIFIREPRLPYHRHSGPGPMGMIIEKCTALKPEARFRSIRKLRSALSSVLRTQDLPAPGRDAADWLARFETVSEWQAADVADLVRFLVRDASATDRNALFRSIDEDVLSALHARDGTMWIALVEAYCQWCGEGGFAFEFCDVLAGRLEIVFALGDVSTQAQAVMALAAMAYSHNRWFVMGRVMALCGVTLVDVVAQRVAIEIAATDAEPEFRRCADGIGRELTVYHPLILAAINDELA